jgi:UDP-N-acetylenolpyruvoylglucosamine reductase
MNRRESGYQELASRLSPESVVRRDEPLAKRTTLRVGGPADLFVEPATEGDLATVLKFCADRSLPFFVLGRGSNLLVRDGGFRGVAISLGHPNFSRIEVDGLRLKCGAGARLKNVAIEARRNGIAGLEFLEGIPGSIGGALRMNAGAMGGETFQIVETVSVMDYSGAVRTLTSDEMDVSYRRCGRLKSAIALGAVLKGFADSPEAIAARMNACNEKRWSSQPAAPSAGCMFKNPDTIPAGRLIDELGLKGMRVGGAKVSLEHGNFLVTDGTATAKDVLQLIEFLKQKAKTERGIELHTEVEIIGQD